MNDEDIFRSGISIFTTYRIHYLKTGKSKEKLPGKAKWNRFCIIRSISEAR